MLLEETQDVQDQVVEVHGVHPPQALLVGGVDTRGGRAGVDQPLALDILGRETAVLGGGDPP